MDKNKKTLVEYSQSFGMLESRQMDFSCSEMAVLETSIKKIIWRDLSYLQKDKGHLGMNSN